MRWLKTLQMYKILTRFVVYDSPAARWSSSHVIIIVLPSMELTLGQPKLPNTVYGSTTDLLMLFSNLRVTFMQLTLINSSNIISKAIANVSREHRILWEAFSIYPCHVKVFWLRFKKCKNFPNVGYIWAIFIRTRYWIIIIGNTIASKQNEYLNKFPKCQEMAI